jgi:hypothetical protein
LIYILIDNIFNLTRNAVAGAAMVEKWSEGDAVGIARQGKGFFAMTKRSGDNYKEDAWLR